jgi:arginine deiminase
MGRLRSQQRQREVDLMKFCFNKLGGWPWGVGNQLGEVFGGKAAAWEGCKRWHARAGSTPARAGRNARALPALNAPPPAGLPIIGEIEAPGYLEGGDFIAMGEDLALVGIGLRR